MKRLIFVCLILLVIGCASAFAQRGAGGGGMGSPGAGGIGAGGNRPPIENGQRRPGQREDGNAAGNRQGGAGENGARQQPRAGRALRGLDLSDEQRQQIRDIERNARENGTDPQTVREQVRSVLTPEQLEKLENRKEKNKGKRENRQNPPAGNSNP